MVTPSTNGSNGRSPNGRFSKGNPGGPGNPQAKRVAELRSALLKSVSAADVEEIIAAMLASAKTGDIAAAKEILDRCIGKAVALDILQRIEDLEETMQERQTK